MHNLHECPQGVNALSMSLSRQILHSSRFCSCRRVVDPTTASAGTFSTDTAAGIAAASGIAAAGIAAAAGIDDVEGSTHAGDASLRRLNCEPSQVYIEPRESS